MWLWSEFSACYVMQNLVCFDVLMNGQKKWSILVSFMLIWEIDMMRNAMNWNGLIWCMNHMFWCEVGTLNWYVWVGFVYGKEWCYYGSNCAWFDMFLAAFGAWIDACLMLVGMTQFWVVIWPCKWPIFSHTVEHTGVCLDRVSQGCNSK